MQLNPARGRKLSFPAQVHNTPFLAVYAAQPREGTETGARRRTRTQGTGSGFMQLNPARGRKQASRRHTLPARLPRFMQLNPARGRKRILVCLSIPCQDREVYAAQPREGTETILQVCDIGVVHAVYAAQPREGTETGLIFVHGGLVSCGLCSSTPRGDGNLSP